MKVMNSRYILSLGIFLIASLTGCHTDKPVYTTNYSTFLSSQDIGILEVQAQRGDGVAAFKLSEYYNFNTDQRDLAIHWLSIAATNGYPSAQYNLGFHYNEINDRQNARYWYERALTNGMDEAAQRLSELR